MIFDNWCCCFVKSLKPGSEQPLMSDLMSSTSWWLNWCLHAGYTFSSLVKLYSAVLDTFDITLTVPQAWLLLVYRCMIIPAICYQCSVFGRDVTTYTEPALTHWFTVYWPPQHPATLHVNRAEITSKHVLLLISNVFHGSNCSSSF